jgi:ribosomal protein L30/L7E
VAKRRKLKFTVFFRVKYYVENVNQLRLSQTRHLYYLQLRKDVLGELVTIKSHVADFEQLLCLCRS